MSLDAGDFLVSRHSAFKGSTPLKTYRAPRGLKMPPPQKDGVVRVKNPRFIGTQCTIIIGSGTARETSDPAGFSTLYKYYNTRIIVIEMMT